MGTGFEGGLDQESSGRAISFEHGHNADSFSTEVTKRVKEVVEGKPFKQVLREAGNDV